jgi:hypothetical protein
LAPVLLYGGRRVLGSYDGKRRRTLGTTWSARFGLEGAVPGAPRIFQYSGWAMPRATSYRRQEIRHLRRLVRRSLNTLVLDEDLVVPEDCGAEPSFVETMSERDIQDWFLTLAPDNSKDH